LVVDFATTYLREQALRTAMGEPYRTDFLAAIDIETQVITYGLAGGPGNSDDLAAYNSTVDLIQKRIANLQKAGNQPGANNLAVGLLYGTWGGMILRPDRTADLHTAAANYLIALSKLKDAFGKLIDNGDKVLTPAMWPIIQPLLNDVEHAYAALSKI
jgi:hypothetical protein